MKASQEIGFLVCEGKTKCRWGILFKSEDQVLEWGAILWKCKTISLSGYNNYWLQKYSSKVGKQGLCWKFSFLFHSQWHSDCFLRTQN